MPRTFTAICLAVIGSFSVANAAPITSETIVHDTTSWVEVDLNANTVLCSAADYGALFLKVGIPELARITLLDHQNVGAGAPCVASGTCEPGHMPENIIDPSKPTELVAINVKAIRYDVADSVAQTCTTHLIERVHLDIRGFEFTHERYAELGSRNFSDCSTAVAPPSGGSSTGGDKADGAGPESSTSGGGCSATNRTTSSLAVLILGAIFGMRRRRRA